MLNKIEFYTQAIRELQQLPESQSKDRLLTFAKAELAELLRLVERFGPLGP